MINTPDIPSSNSNNMTANLFGRRAMCWLNQPRDIAALAMFRILFGLLMGVGLIRFMANGWVDKLFLEPTFQFKYWGFEWVVVPPPMVLYGIFTAAVVCAFLVALGCFYRVAIIGFLLLFTYTELMDVTTYLNHHYLVIIFAFVLCFLSPHRAWSVDAWRHAQKAQNSKPSWRMTTLPAWQTYWLRFHVAMLYFYAGWAKFESDWLLHAQPLNIWLPPLEGTPIIGVFLSQIWVHYAFSWFAFMFDVTIIAFMLFKRTRLWAFALIVFFHLLTHLFFNIGLFPFIMVLAVMVYFDADWPRQLVVRLRRQQPTPNHHRRTTAASSTADVAKRLNLKPLMALAIAVFCTVQFVMPLRQWAYDGTVLWHEQGMRFSWRVMLREKSGSLNYRVVNAAGNTQQVTPYAYLNENQYREMSGQPDLILQLAHRIRDDMNAKGVGPVQVYADAMVSLNGRQAKAMIDPATDLAAIEYGLANADWITAPPAEPPPLHSPLSIPIRERGAVSTDNKRP